MPGPAPMPTKLKIMPGNRGKRPLNDREPEPELKIPDKPDVLHGIAAEEWQRITKLLHELELLTEIDSTALAAYCQAYERWVMAEKEIRKHGMVIKAPSGYPVQSPYLSISNKALEHMKKFLVEFGMTPASRTRVKVPKKKDTKSDFGDI